MTPPTIPAGATGPWQPMPRVPWLPSEYRIRKTAFPLALSSASPMRSINPGVWTLANSQLASPLTWYVPLPVLTPLLNVSQVPPPVTAPDVPPLAGATKVPEPVSLIFRVFGLRALANATPCGLMVVTGMSTLMMSHRTWAALAWPSSGERVNRAIAIAPRLHRTRQNRVLTLHLLR